MSSDNTQTLHEQVKAALESASPLSIHGAGSHDFLTGDFAEATRLDMTAHSGIIDYQPSELTLRARAGTRVNEILDTLAAEGQRLGAEIPCFADDATIGGALAMGLTGSGRPFLGAVRDHVLGTQLINGVGEIINCGGQVMKNVAGYDISRLLAGSRGGLGPILDITLKILPKPEKQTTLVFEIEQPAAIAKMNQTAARPVPVTASAYLDGHCYMRLEGSQSGVDHAAELLGGETLPDDSRFWHSLTHLNHAFFAAESPLWRVLTPSTEPPLRLGKAHTQLIDWCGGLRWIKSDELSDSDFDSLRQLGCRVERFGGADTTPPQALMSPLQKKLQQRVKQAFDPKLIFNPKLSRFD